jgi:hypothetical protein
MIEHRFSYSILFVSMMVGVCNPDPAGYPEEDELDRWQPGTPFGVVHDEDNQPVKKQRILVSRPQFTPRAVGVTKEAVYMRPPPMTAEPPEIKTQEEEQWINDVEAAFHHDAAELVPLSQTHRHSRTCLRLRQGVEECRFRYPKVGVKASYVDQSGVHHFKRDHHWMSNYNLVLTVALRCNTDVSMILNGGDANSIAFYITDYITKKVAFLSSLNLLLFLID